MSKAIKCDRCGCCFDPERIRNAFTVMTEVFSIGPESYKKHAVDDRMERAELCPSCSVIFRDFMDGEKFVEQKCLDALQEDYDSLREDYDDLCVELANLEQHQVDTIRQFKEEQLKALGDIPAEDIKKFILEAVERATFGGCREKRKTVDDWIGKRCCE